MVCPPVIFCPAACWPPLHQLIAFSLAGTQLFTTACVCAHARARVCVFMRESACEQKCARLYCIWLVKVCVCVCNKTCFFMCMWMFLSACVSLHGRSTILLYAWREKTHAEWLVWKLNFQMDYTSKARLACVSTTLERLTRWNQLFNHLPLINSEAKRGLLTTMDSSVGF